MNSLVGNLVRAPRGSNRVVPSMFQRDHAFPRFHLIYCTGVLGGYPLGRITPYDSFGHKGLMLIPRPVGLRLEYRNSYDEVVTDVW